MIKQSGFLFLKNAIIACRLSTFHATKNPCYHNWYSLNMLWPEFVFLHFSIEGLVINSYIKKKDTSKYSTLLEICNRNAFIIIYISFCNSSGVYRLYYRVVFSKSWGQKTQQRTMLIGKLHLLNLCGDTRQ